MPLTVQDEDQATVQYKMQFKLMWIIHLHNWTSNKDTNSRFQINLFQVTGVRFQNYLENERLQEILNKVSDW